MTSPSRRAPVLQPGDRIRFSTELLQRIHAQRDHLSEIVTLVRVRTEDDGTKTLIVERTEDNPIEVNDADLPY